MSPVTPNEAIILAGGTGTRLRPVIGERQKCMAIVNGRPFLDRLVEYWSGQGICQFHFCTGYQHEEVFQYFGDERGPLKFRYHQETTPQGTGGALLGLDLHLQSKTVLVINGDTFCPLDLNEMMDSHLRSCADVTVASAQTTDSSERFTRLQNGQIVAGVYLIESMFLDMRFRDRRGPLHFERDLLPNWQRNGAKISYFSSATNFLDIGVPEDYFRASTLGGLNG